MISHIPLFFILPPLSPLIFKDGLLLWVKIKQVRGFGYIYTLHLMQGGFTWIICYLSDDKKRELSLPQLIGF